MNVRFIDPDPRRVAKHPLDEVLAFGTDQIAIASAFLTMGGVKILTPHFELLRLPDSFIVVSLEPPTCEDALLALQDALGSNLFVHLGSKTPSESGVGRGIMHSKVYYARSGSKCRLWVGSHNLTASAMLGVNCEAAILLEGDADEQPFKDALQHLTAVRDEAVKFDGQSPERFDGEEETLIIHAESEHLTASPPWFTHFRSKSTELDRLLVPGNPVWLYLYPIGTLKPGVVPPEPSCIFSGEITAQSFTPEHPSQGLDARWDEADFVIEQREGVFRMERPGSLTDARTQAVLKLLHKESTKTVWLETKPAVRVENVVRKEWLSSVPPGFRAYFSADSFHSGSLKHRMYGERQKVLSLPASLEARGVATAALRKLQIPMNLPVSYRKEKSKGLLDFIYRAVFRLDL